MRPRGPLGCRIARGAGCNNSAANGGTVFGASGSASLAHDTLSLTQSNELVTSLSIFLQGDLDLPTGVVFGDGVRCADGTLTRLYVRVASSGGTVSAPTVGTDPSVHDTSAALGDPLSPGESRYYGVYYRDSAPVFCPSPPGNTWNIGNGYRVIWTN